MNSFKSVKLSMLLFACLFSLSTMRCMEEVTENMKQLAISDECKDCNVNVKDIVQGFNFDTTLYDQFYNKINHEISPIAKQRGISLQVYLYTYESEVKDWIEKFAIDYIKAEEALIAQDHGKRDQLLTFFWLALITRNCLVSSGEENRNMIISLFKVSDIQTLARQEEFLVKLILNKCILNAFLSPSIHLDLDVYFKCDNGSVVKPIAFILRTIAFSLMLDDEDYDLSLLEKLLFKGAHVNSLNICVLPFGGEGILKGVTPLMILSVIEQMLIISLQEKLSKQENLSKASAILHRSLRLLIKYGANIDALIPESCRPHGGCGSILLAFNYKATEMVKLLIKEDCYKLNIPVKEGIKSPLFSALFLNDFKKVESLLESGADTNVMFGVKKRKPIHIAVLKLSLPLVKLLRSYGADLNVKTGSKPEKLNLQGKECSEIDAIIFNVDNAVHGHTLLFSLITHDPRINQVELGASAGKKFIDMLNYLLSNGAMLSKEEYQYLIYSKKTNLIFDKLLRNCSKQKLLKELLDYAKLVENNAAANIIQQKIISQQAKHDRVNSSNASRSKRRGRRCRSKSSRRNRKKKQKKEAEEKKEIVQTDLAELEDVFNSSSYDSREEYYYDLETKQVTHDIAENIKVLGDNDETCKFTYHDLVNFGGKRLTMILDKTHREFPGVGDISVFGFGLSRRVTNGSRRDPKFSQNVQNGEWVENEQTLKNPKMNNPHDPTHAFPQYIEKNFAQYCRNLHKTTDFNKFDKIDAKQAGRKLSEFAVKMYFEIPGKLLVEGTIQVGHFEYVILVPNDQIANDNRPLCVHRFFRANK